MCGISQADAANGFTCRNCRSQISRTKPPWCEQCGLPFGGAVGEAVTCKNCYEAKWQFACARSIMAARGLVREVIHRYKYNQHEFFEPLMILWLHSCGSLFPDQPQCIVPVPLHPVKERERGFNQAERLAAGVAKYLGLPMETKFLRRVKYTKTQTNLTRKERLANMHNAFEAPGRMPFSRLLLIDDVMTTGSTASACAAALRGAGAARVDVLTLARGMPD